MIKEGDRIFARAAYNVQSGSTETELAIKL